MYLIAMCGQDVDCNAAQIGAALGAMRGSAGINRRWSEPLGDRIVTYLRDFKELSLKDLIRRTVDAAINKN
jgi:hypothetical protein